MESLRAPYWCYPLECDQPSKLVHCLHFCLLHTSQRKQRLYYTTVCTLSVYLLSKIHHLANIFHPNKCSLSPKREGMASESLMLEEYKGDRWSDPLMAAGCRREVRGRSQGSCQSGLGGDFLVQRRLSGLVYI